MLWTVEEPDAQANVAARHRAQSDLMTGLRTKSMQRGTRGGRRYFAQAGSGEGTLVVNALPDQQLPFPVPSQNRSASI